ncbi:MAG: hypothetical protein IH602_13890 [Bryobacteraceae bacterium]|nr:hypothetical protein [Bryobacteraceae bacterium]
MLCCPLLLLMSGHVFQPPAADAPDPKEKARQFLESASGMIAAAPPESQAPALFQLATVEKAANKVKAIEHLEQAFAAAAVLPSRKDNRLKEQTQALIVRELAINDLDLAIEKIASMDITPPDEIDPRAEAIEQIVAGLVREKKLDEASAVMDRFASTGAYSFGGARALLTAMSPDDDRRALLFGQVVSAFSRRPDIRPMELFVREFSPRRERPMPKSLFDTAIRAMVDAALDNKGIVEPSTLTITTDKATISLNDPQDSVLWRLIDLAVLVDQDLVRKAIRDRPSLTNLVELFPAGMTSMAKGDAVMTAGTLVGDGPNSREAQEKQQRLIVETARFQEVMKYYRKDPAKALEASRGIPTPVLRVRAITTVARNVDETEPAAAKATIEKCIAALEEMKPPETRASGWSGIAMAAGKIKDKELATRALLKGLDDIKAQYAADADPDNPNGAPRPMWPSSVSYRNLFYQAAKILGTETENFLEKVQDPEIQALARIEMAGAWLGVQQAQIPIRTLKKQK